MERREFKERLDPNHLNIWIVPPFTIESIGGVQDHIINEGIGLQKIGHTVTIIAPKPRDRDRKDPSRHDTDIPIKHLGYSWPIYLHGSRSENAFLPEFPWKVTQFLRENPPDIIHFHEPEVSALSLQLVPLARLVASRSINVVTLHAVNQNPTFCNLWKPVGRLYQNLAHVRTAVSDSAKKQGDLYWPGEYHLIPNGVDTQFFIHEGPIDPEFDDGKINILYLGRFEDRKGVPYLIETFALLRKDRDDIRLILAGPGGPQEENLKNRVKELDQERDIYFLGKITKEDLPKLYRTADIFCSFAIQNESFGMTNLQAMACGKPVIAGNIPGYRTIVKDGQNGLLVDPKNRQQALSALRFLVNNRQKREEMGARGREMSLDFDWDKSIIPMYLNLFLIELAKRNLI